MEQKMLVVDPVVDFRILRALGSKARVKILTLVAQEPRNVQDIAAELDLPQSTVATSLIALEKAGLIETVKTSGRKGTQKISNAVYSSVVIEFPHQMHDVGGDDVIEVEMPIGLYDQFEVSAPCGLCSAQAIIGYLDVPDSFLWPDRVKAALIWFEKGFVQYKFPNNSLYADRHLASLELVTELSSEVPGTNKEWLSDITLWVNDVRVGRWTSPGDYGDKRGKFTPSWWKLEGSQYGLLKRWKVTGDGSYVDGIKISEVNLNQLRLPDHHSISVRIGVEEDATHVGGMNIFGRGFGNYDQDLVLRLTFN